MAVDTVKCGNCGTENPDDEDFCKECGQPLTQSAEEGLREHAEAQGEGGVLSTDPSNRPHLPND